MHTSDTVEARFERFKHYTATAAHRIPAALRRPHSAKEWKLLSEAERAAHLRAAIAAEMIEGKTIPDPAQPAAPVKAAPSPTSRYFVGCSKCGEPVAIPSFRTRRIHCGTC